MARTKRSLSLTAGLLLLLSLSAVAARADVMNRPQRVVSVNLCSDILVQLLAEPEQIASLTFMASEEGDNPLASEARAYPINHGLSEEILPLDPDLVLAHQFTSPFLISMLRRFDIRVVQIGDSNSLQGVRDNVRLVADAIGRAEAGEALLEQFDAELAASMRPLDGQAPRTILFHDQGATAGPGDLLGELMTRAGLRNVAPRHDGAWQSISVEDVVRASPDLLLIGRYRGETRSQSNAILGHRALEAAVGRDNIRDVLAKNWICGTPFVSHVAAAFAEASDAYVRRQK